MRPARIRVAIQELVLDAFSPLDGRRIADALQAELSRLLAEEGIPQSLVRVAEVDRIDAGEMRLPGGGPGRIGRALAGVLYRGLGR